MAPASDSALVLFPGALGDFMCFLPTLLALRNRHTGSLLIVAQPAFLELVWFRDAATASIDRREIADLFVAGFPLAAETRKLFAGFTWVYSWSGFGSHDFAKRLAIASGGQVNVHRFRGMEPGEHAVDYYARCAGLPPRVPTAQDVVQDTHWLTAFERQHELDDQPVMVMHPGSGSPKKNWVGFGAVARYWREQHGSRVVVLYGPAETERTSLPEGTATLVDQLSLPQVAALLRRSSVFLGNDSGISHLAGAVGARGVVAFGPTDPTVWAPRGGRLHVVHAHQPCVRCGPDLFCLHRLPAETVIGALEGRHDRDAGL